MAKLSKSQKEVAKRRNLELENRPANVATTGDSAKTDKILGELTARLAASEALIANLAAKNEALTEKK